MRWKLLAMSLFILAGILVGVVFIQTPKDIRNRAAITGPELSMQTASTAQPNGSTFTVGILLNSGPDQVSAVDLILPFDPNAIEILSFSPTTALPVVLTPFSVRTGEARVTLGAQPDSLFRGSTIIGTMTVQSKTNNPFSLGLSNSTQVAAIGKTSDALVAHRAISFNESMSSPTPTHSATESPTPTFSATGTPTHSPTPTQISNPTSQTLEFRVKLAGVTGAEAQGAKIGVKFYLKDGTVRQLSSPLTLTHQAGGVYKTSAVITNPFPSGTQFRIHIKGEKHIAITFCRQTGQTSRCADGEFITAGPTTFDFTGIPLPAGDLPVQDGRADMGDLNKLRPLMSKICSSLTTAEKLIGDVNYDGCVTVRDIFLMLQTLETRYDE